MIVNYKLPPFTVESVVWIITTCLAQKQAETRPNFAPSVMKFSIFVSAKLIVGFSRLFMDMLSEFPLLA